MIKIFLGMDKEKIVIAGLTEDGSCPVVQEWIGGGDFPQLANLMQILYRNWGVESCYEA